MKCVSYSGHEVCDTMIRLSIVLRLRMLMTVDEVCVIQWSCCLVVVRIKDAVDCG